MFLKVIVSGKSRGRHLGLMAWVSIRWRSLPNMELDLLDSSSLAPVMAYGNNGETPNLHMRTRSVLGGECLLQSFYRMEG